MASKGLLKHLLILSLSFGFFICKAQTYQWARDGYSMGYDYGNSMVTDDSGNVYIGGQIEYSANFDGHILNTNGKHDILVGKYNTNGTIQWIKHAGGLGGDVGWGVGIDKFHNVYLTGEFELTAGWDPGDSMTVAGANDIFLVKYDANGNVIWTRRMGSGGDDKSRAIAVDANGYSYVTGYFSNNSTFGSFTVNSSGGNDFFIAKYSPTGTCLWVKKAGGPQEDRGRGVVLDPFGNLYVCGTFSNSINFNGTNYTTPSNNSAFIAKYDTSGSFQWVKTAGACCDTSRYNAVTCDASGNAYVTGYFKDAMIIGTNNLSTKGNSDVVIAKYSPSGAVLWAKDEGGVDEDMGYHLTFDNRKNLLYVTGFYDYQADFDSLHLNSFGNRDAFLTAFDPTGKIQWARSAGGNARDVGQAVAVDTLGNIYETGFFNTYADFDANHLTGDTLADFFLAKSSPALALQPSSVSSAINASVVNCNNIQLTWTSGNGNGRIVVARASQAVNVFPGDGNSFNANAVFGNGANLGNGNFVVYNGTGNSTVVSGLQAGTEYFFTVIEYNGSSVTTNYNTDAYTSTSYLVNGFAMNLSSSVPSICPGDEATLSVSGGVSYQWSPNYQLSSVTGSSVNASPVISTTYTVDGVNSNGCHSVDHIIVYVNPLPVVQYDNTIEVCLNASPVSLSGGIPAGGLYSGPSVNNGMFNPVTAGAGLNIVSYTYTDANGCTATDTAAILVNSLPVITMPSFQSVCENGQPVILTGALPAGGNYSGTAVTAGMFDPAITGPGMNPISYSYTDNHGCQNSSSANLIVNALPNVTMSSFTPVCENSTPVSLTGGNPSGGTFSGDGVSSNIFSATSAGTGDHIITYTYTDNNSCSNSTSTIMNVRTLPSVMFASLNPVCENNQPVNLSGGTPAGGTYAGAGVSNNMFSPVITGTGNFTMTYTYQDQYGCVNSAQQSITVNPQPVLSLVVPADLCSNGAPVTLAGGNPAGGVYSGQNTTNGIFYPSNVAPGQYSVTYSYTDNHNCSNSISKTINVRSVPVANLGADTVVCAGSAIVLNAGAGYSSYHWSNGANTQSIQVSLGLAGIIHCAVTVTDSYNCSNSDTVQVTFDQCNGIQNVLSDIPWCYVYPNPFVNSFKIFSEKKILIRIFDVSGRLIEEKECEGTIEAGQNLSKGVYFIDAVYNNQKKTYKVIKAE